MNFIKKIKKGKVCSLVMVMVFNATFNNASVISWWSVLLVEEIEVPEKTTDLPQVTDKLYHIVFTLVSSTPWPECMQSVLNLLTEDIFAHKKSWNAYMVCNGICDTCSFVLQEFTWVSTIITFLKNIGYVDSQNIFFRFLPWL